MVSLRSIRYRRTIGGESKRSRSSRSAQRLGYQFGDLGRVRRRPYARPPQGLALGLRRALASGDDGPGVAHGLAFRRGEARDVSHYRCCHLAPDVLGGELLGVAPDLAYHHGAFGLGIRLEEAQDLDEVRPYYGVAPDAHGRALPDPTLR